VTIDEKYDLLVQILKKFGRALVAYSGGVDSTFLLKACIDTLGAKNILACIAAGPSLPQSQYAKAVEMAKNFNVSIKTVEPDELADKAFSANKANRCFICKSHLYQMLNNIAKEEKYDYVLCGSNTDDYDDYRPGNKAAKIFNIRCPLAEANLTKNDIRQLSRKLSLPTADIPASPCLASRISYGEEITGRKLNRVEQAEEYLRNSGFIEFRVRLHGELARIEVHEEDMDKIAAQRKKIAAKLKSLGFKFVSVDLEGFRSGSLNEMLSKEDKQKNL
jgi:uncharacterized protein